MKSGVYEITNIVNQKRYIGSTVDLSKRKAIHFHYLRRNTHDNRSLQSSYNEHGAQSFVFRILERCEVEFLLEREQFWIDQYSNRGILFNKSLIAGSNIGIERTPPSLETKRKISEAKKGNNYWLGKHHTEETKRKLSEARKNPSVEMRQKMSASHKGKKPTQEQRENCAKAHWKPVYQMNPLTKEVIRKWESAKEAGQKLNIDSSTIGKVCKGQKKTTGGFSWAYADK